jgi:hypothetical protein
MVMLRCVGLAALTLVVAGSGSSQDSSKTADASRLVYADFQNSQNGLDNIAFEK